MVHDTRTRRRRSDVPSPSVPQGHEEMSKDEMGTGLSFISMMQL